MTILFVYPNLMRQENISLGLAFLSSYLKKRGHLVGLVDYTWGGDAGDCLEKIERLNPDIIGFSAKSGEVDFCLDISRKIKQHSNKPVLFGGVHATVAPEELITSECVDMVCVGEGEEALGELLDRMEEKKDIYSVKNFWFKRNGRIIKNEPRPLTSNLDSLPLPDRELFGLDSYIQAKAGAVDIISGRGCPYQCTYCINDIQQRLYKDKGKFARRRSVADILEEIGSIIERYRVSLINFQDDVFTLDKGWLLEFADKYPKVYRIPFVCNGRAETIDREVCKILKSSGCLSLNIGIESGSERIRREVLNRLITNKKIIEAFDSAKKVGLRTYSFNMVGIPFETKQDIAETIDLNRVIKPSILQVSLFQPYPGTRLRKVCEREGWLRSKSVPFSHQMNTIVNLPHFKPRQLRWIKKTFRFQVLRKDDFLKSILVLIFDLSYPVFIRVRHRIPSFIKRMLFFISRKLWLNLKAKKLSV